MKTFITALFLMPFLTFSQLDNANTYPSNYNPCPFDTIVLYAPINSNWVYSWSSNLGWTSTEANPLRFDMPVDTISLEMIPFGVAGNFNPNFIYEIFTLTVFDSILNQSYTHSFSVGNLGPRKEVRVSISPAGVFCPSDTLFLNFSGFLADHTEGVGFDFIFSEMSNYYNEDKPETYPEDSIFTSTFFNNSFMPGMYDGTLIEWNWTGPNGFFSEYNYVTVPNPIGGVYTFNFRDGNSINNCFFSIDFNVTVIEYQDNYSTDSLISCTNYVEVDLSPYDSIFWNGGHLPTSNFSVTDFGWYFYSVTEQGCTFFDSLYLDGIESFANVWQSDDSLCKKESFSFGVSGLNSAFWNYPSGFTSNLFQNNIQSISSFDFGEYTLTGEYTNGCLFDTTIFLFPKDFESCIDIPEIITPNNDLLNDGWNLDFLVDFPNNKVSVFNRWGTEVFTAAPYTPENEFKGFANKGLGVSSNIQKHLPSSTYFYIIDLYGDSTKTFNGPLEVQK